MWLPPQTTVAPTDVIIAPVAAKDYLRVDTSDDDQAVTDAVADAVSHVESYTGTRLATQTVKLRTGSFGDLDHFPIGPVQSISSITYLDAAGAEQTLDPDSYELFGAGLESGIRSAINVTWPITRQVKDAISVTAVVGYGAAADVPRAVRRAVLLLVGDYYQSREDTIAERSVVPATLPNGVDTLLANHRIYG